jgi:hypothetical protein
MPMDARYHDSTTSTGDSPSQGAVENTESVSGLKPIKRLTSDDRIARIVPTADYATEIEYYSQFSRDFIRAHYNFCASKMTVARGGKSIALDFAFREAEEWFGNTIAWCDRFDRVPYPMSPEKIGVGIPIPIAGRLVGLIDDYDRLYIMLSYAVFAGSLSNDVRDKVLRNAYFQIMTIHDLCVPDTDRFDVGGQLQSTE